MTTTRKRNAIIRKNMVSISGGNDSVAMLQWVIENREFFKGETFTAVYCNTGWSVSWWNDRMTEVKSFCEKNDIAYEETFAELGFEELVRKKCSFPHQFAKFCTFELKVKPLLQWRKDNKFTVRNSRVLIGVRADESIARKDTVSLGERDGYEAIYPLAHLSSSERDSYITKAGFDVLPHRSKECHPCIFERTKGKLRTIEKDRIQVIEDLERDLTVYLQAKRKLQKDPKYLEGEVYGMFNSKHLGKKAGIREQLVWANSPHGNYKGEEDDGLCKEQVGYCGD
jgi:3'-phosphoadenosine 5'-phosphosulfate sulfotransferase (PAPS reductase)/FAD synthetase